VIAVGLVVGAGIGVVDGFIGILVARFARGSRDARQAVFGLADVHAIERFLVFVLTQTGVGIQQAEFQLGRDLGQITGNSLIDQEIFHRS